MDLRPIYFDVLEKASVLGPTFTVRSPMPGDRILVLFWSDKDLSNASLRLTNESTVGP